MKHGLQERQAGCHNSKELLRHAPRIHILGHGPQVVPFGLSAPPHHCHELDDARDAGKRPHPHQRADQDALHRWPANGPKECHGRNREEHVVNDIEARPGDGNRAYRLRIGVVVAVVGQIPPVA